MDKLPEHFSIDDLVDHAVLIEKVQRGLNDIASDRVNSKNNARKKLAKWLK
ncbi:hypothetical protein [Olivibacter sitiensis]|uniref:hypothetical protein n=1 Tax=Olivibacter sitiensis TaxID=376470 RepID=UPI0012FAEBC2|nr:hypothetical protein [Olivibacter sitiensis]